MDWSKKIFQITEVFGITKKELAARIGFNAPYISEVVRGKNKNPSFAFIEALGKLGVNADWLVNDRGSILADNSAVQDCLTTAAADVIDIRAELRDKGYDNLTAAIVSDNNMQPTFSRGDVAVYSAGLIDTDGIYAITEGGSGAIRRLQFLRQEDAVLVISDNPQYQPRRLPLSKIGEYLKIEGRVVCRILFE